ncbi:MAG: ADP-ribosyl-[dinitrogen reductase] hydrolase [Ahrensia sp.]|nr:ADP-ribosyl-[dinitrogen reductase] hydrolase [Ahrensia sp.]
METGTIEDQARDRAIGALVGLAIGDALGTTLEFKDRDTEPPLEDMIGGGPFGLEPGEWTDDTSMALCLADSLIAKSGRVDLFDLLERFLAWYRSGTNSSRGVCFDIGNATRDALEAFERDATTRNNAHEALQANGSIMRLAPVVISARNVEEACSNAARQSLTTHAAPVPVDCCVELAETLWTQIETGALYPPIGTLCGRARETIVSSGHAPATLEAAKWAVANSGDFAEAALLAVNLGGDADTVGAVTGQIAGSLYGLSGIPETWLRKIFWRDIIQDKAQKLWDLRSVADA